MILAIPIGLLFVNLYHYRRLKDITDSLSVLVGHRPVPPKRNKVPAIEAKGIKSNQERRS